MSFGGSLSAEALTRLLSIVEEGASPLERAVHICGDALRHEATGRQLLAGRRARLALARLETVRFGHAFYHQSALSAWFVGEWETIRQLSDADWCAQELEYEFKERRWSTWGLPKLCSALETQGVFLVAWALYQRRLRRALCGSELEIQLMMPLSGTHRLELKGEYRYVGDGIYVDRCWRPQCVVSAPGRPSLRLSGEVKIDTGRR